MIEGRKIPPFLKKYKKYEKDFIQIEQTKANKRQIKRVDDELYNDYFFAFSVIYSGRYFSYIFY